MAKLLYVIEKIGEPLELAEEDQFMIFVGRTPYRIMCTPNKSARACSWISDL